MYFPEPLCGLYCKAAIEVGGEDIDVTLFTNSVLHLLSENVAKYCDVKNKSVYTNKIIRKLPITVNGKLSANKNILNII
jgi:hypothetical protein